jgi:hypothetical protein
MGEGDILECCDGEWENYDEDYTVVMEYCDGKGRTMIGTTVYCSSGVL